MNIHEYQAKILLADAGMAIPRGVLIESLQDVSDAVQQLGAHTHVVKAQIHAGGRGKAGGVQVCTDIDAVHQCVKGLLGAPLITHQTGVQGRVVHKIYIEEGLKIAQEFYLALLLDRDAACPAFVVSAAGGVDIETVAEETPEKILTLPLHPAIGASPHILRRMGFFLGLADDVLKQFCRLAAQLYDVFIRYDASLLELNPLVLTCDHQIVALDAKLSVDDNALYRQARIVAFRDLNEEDPRETCAATHGLNYIALEGSIGCMVNGAGLAMATMDMIHLKGAEPANFLDVGGGVTAIAVCEAFMLLFADAQVKGILVNIFGGIVRCDIIAQGLLDAVAKSHADDRVPIVLRLVGTHEQEGQQMIRNAGIDVLWANDLDQAADAIVHAVQGVAA
ncbi:MAG: ADP-forming succinate--CoA ligase subunit beta [Mariprofundaceae bacterium]|nr:ADP-forming succinate--CoA ligase subunit beta [Mariprofundaceae bacterium]